VGRTISEFVEDGNTVGPFNGLVDSAPKSVSRGTVDNNGGKTHEFEVRLNVFEDQTNSL
jgi:hypothetical protein